MRVLLVALVLLGLPLTGSAQKQERRSDRGEKRERQPEPARSGLSPIGLPPLPDHSIQRPWTGGHQIAPWERQQTPWWERQGPPAWERARVAQPVVVPNRNLHRKRSPSVVYVMQPYPVQVEPPEAKVVYVMVPQPAPVIVREPEPEPEPKPPSPPPPPVVVPIGNRTMYMVPGCYLGNVEPTAAMLPVGCDLGRLKIVRP